MNGKCLKWISPGNIGVPDRIIIVPGLGVIFVELKTEDGKISAMQKWWMKWLRQAGTISEVLKGKNEVNAFCDGLERLLQEKKGGGDAG